MLKDVKMIKITSRGILLRIIGSLTIVSCSGGEKEKGGEEEKNISRDLTQPPQELVQPPKDHAQKSSLDLTQPPLAHTEITFDGKKESTYTSPIIYLIGNEGQKPVVEIKEGISAIGGVDEKSFNFTELTSVSFDIRGKINIEGLKIIPISREEDPFCKQLDLSLKSSPEGNKILLPSTFPKLTTSTICHFKIVSLDNEKNNVTENKITFIFNYTLPVWLSYTNLERKRASEVLRTAEAQIAAEAQRTAEALRTAETLRTSQAQIATEAQRTAEALRASQALRTSQAQIATEAQKTAEALRIEVAEAEAWLKVLEAVSNKIHINFDKKGLFYTSPVVYLTGVDGQNPRVAMKEGVPTTGGVDANENDFTEFTFVSFNIRGKINLDGLKIVPISREEDPFCKQLDLSLKSSPEGNKILLPSTFPKLTTSTSCHFKIVSLDDTKNEVTENKITFIFNYTLQGWLSDFGNGTEAQKTAQIIRDMNINPNSKQITLKGTHDDSKFLVDISPFMGFIQTVWLDLSDNKIEVIPDSIGDLTNLKGLELKNNQIKVIPDSIGNLTNLKNIELDNNQIKVIPDSIGNLTNLKYFSFRNNQIKVIPDSIGNLTNLEYLILNDNKIEVIPDSIRNLTNLKYVLLNDNKIEVIPDSIGNLINLKVLELQNNQIKVTPDSIGYLKLDFEYEKLRYFGPN